MPFPLSPQSIDAIADIISGGGGHDTTPPIGIYRSGPKIEKFMRACNVAFTVNGSRVPSLVQCLINLNNGFEADQALPRIIEAAADPRDFIHEPERHIAVLDHLNRALRFDGFEVQQQGGRMRLVEAGKNVPVLAELAGLSEVIDFDTVSRDLERAVASSQTDPEDAVTAACSTVESVCRSILIELGLPLPAKKDVQGLYNAVKQPLGLSPDRSDLEPLIAGDVRQILSGLATVIGGIGALRTHGGDAHGREKGYGADQFRQIVLLPQGKFETFLAAKTDARVEILRDLFDVKIFRDLAAQLKDEASEAERALRDQRALYMARLEERGFESAEALELGIAAAEFKVEEKRGIQQGAETANEVARKALSEGEQIEKAFSAVDTTRQALDDLEAKTVEVDDLAKRVEAVKNALRAHDLETGWRDAEHDSRSAVNAVTKAEGELNTATGAKKRAAQKLVEAQSGEERRQQVQADLTRLEAIEKQVGQAAELQKAFDEAARDETSARKALTKAVESREGLKSQRDATDLALEQARKAEAARGKLTGELAENNRERVKAVAQAKAQGAVADAQQDVEAAASELTTRTEAALAADAALVEAEARLTRTQAIILAEKLTEGAACPVCGSHDHPTPAYGTPEQSGLTEAFRSAQTKARTSSEARVRAESELDNWRARLDEKKRTLDEQERPERTLAELEVEIVRLEGTLAALGETVDLDAMAEQLADLKRKVTEVETVEAKARAVAGRAETTLAEARAKRDTVVEALPEGLRTPEAVVARQKALQSEQGQLSKALELSIENDRVASEALTRAQEQLEAAKRARDAQALRVEKAQGDFDVRLAEVGLDKAGYEACKAHFPTLDADRKMVSDHREGLIAARTTWQNARATCADRERPDLAPLQLALENVTQELKIANDALSAARSDVSSLTKFKESLAEALAKTERLETETGPLRGLADLANGKNDFKMTLETFAIGAMFDQVLEAANMRLDPMTRGRYRLVRGVEASGGRGKRGLEIEVFDINTGKARPTATLSGGETFIAALALALGLADVVESLSGKIRMDTIFIDEGFGSLDTENGAGTLDQVIQVLAALTEGSRAVGLISHVGLVQEAIPQGFYVRSTPSGSRVEERRGLG